MKLKILCTGNSVCCSLTPGWLSIWLVVTGFEVTESKYKALVVNKHMTSYVPYDLVYFEVKGVFCTLLQKKREYFTTSGYLLLRRKNPNVFEF